MFQLNFVADKVCPCLKISFQICWSARFECRRISCRHHVVIDYATSFFCLPRLLLKFRVLAGRCGYKDSAKQERFYENFFQVLGHEFARWMGNIDLPNGSSTLQFDPERCVTWRLCKHKNPATLYLNASPYRPFRPPLMSNQQGSSSASRSHQG